MSQQAAKCIPAMVCPELTEQIRREVAASLHQRKGEFTCYFLTDLVTFTLPAGQPSTDLVHTTAVVLFSLVTVYSCGVLFFCSSTLKLHVLGLYDGRMHALC